ncbi:hypothetical protein GCK72_023453 [Caenorhabditis remanei]|uniref:Uncharacterized protein n=1 Tax=Caenorhabditis remanei TaxID=31234 RepID=A0A6A5FWX9_CAERE|nr:hypothetical protein GCK72_023453 [Caenorhabditis remanei]KAF1746995.1 hypothetical protein GCK72_023453 [Caenorhabditis remanei]
MTSIQNLKKSREALLAKRDYQKREKEDKMNAMQFQLDGALRENERLRKMNQELKSQRDQLKRENETLRFADPVDLRHWKCRCINAEKKWTVQQHLAKNEKATTKQDLKSIKNALAIERRAHQETKIALAYYRNQEKIRSFQSHPATHGRPVRMIRDPVNTPEEAQSSTFNSILMNMAARITPPDTDESHTDTSHKEKKPETLAQIVVKEEEKPETCRFLL